MKDDFFTVNNFFEATFFYLNLWYLFIKCWKSCGHYYWSNHLYALLMFLQIPACFYNSTIYDLIGAWFWVSHINTRMWQKKSCMLCATSNKCRTVHVVLHLCCDLKAWIQQIIIYCICQKLNQVKSCMTDFLLKFKQSKSTKYLHKIPHFISVSRVFGKS